MAGPVRMTLKRRSPDSTSVGRLTIAGQTPSWRRERPASVAAPSGRGQGVGRYVVLDLGREGRGAVVGAEDLVREDAQLALQPGVELGIEFRLPDGGDVVLAQHRADQGLEDALAGAAWPEQDQRRTDACRLARNRQPEPSSPAIRRYVAPTHRHPPARFWMTSRAGEQSPDSGFSRGAR